MLREFRGHGGFVSCFGLAGPRLVSGGSDGAVKVRRKGWKDTFPPLMHYPLLTFNMCETPLLAPFLPSHTDLGHEDGAVPRHHRAQPSG